jgi:serine/threonine-protein kinase
MYLRNCDEAIKFYDRSIAVAPDQVWGYGFKALAQWLGTADLPAARVSLEAAPGEREPWIDFLFFWQEFFERDYEAARERAASAGVEFFEDASHAVPAAALEAYAYLMMGEESKAQVLFNTARDLLERELSLRPDDSRIHSMLGIVYAVLGNKDDAVREATRAVEITPVSADAIRGSRFEEFLAWTHVLVGENDEAIDKIDYLLSIPSLASVAMIETDPRWDPLRDDPKFQAVLSKHSKASP